MIYLLMIKILIQINILNNLFYLKIEFIFFFIYLKHCMNHKKFVNHMKHTLKKLMNKKTWSSINLKYAIENNAYDGINVSKLINDNPKILNKLYHDNIYYTLLFIKNYIPSIYIVYNSPSFLKGIFQD